MSTDHAKPPKDKSGITTIDLENASAEELEKINSDIVRRLAERAKKESKKPPGYSTTGHDSVYHSKNM